MTPPPPLAPLFSRAQLWRLPLAFGATTFALHHLVRFVRRFVAFDAPRYWPFSVFFRRAATVERLLPALLAAILGTVMVRWLERRGYPLTGVATLALLLILATNLIQGTLGGFFTPIAGGGPHGIQYFHDAQRMERAGESALTFLRTFNADQPGLLEHARTHPPGAVLLFYALNHLLSEPAVIALVLAVVSTLLLAYFFRDLAHVLGADDPAFAGYGAFLLLLLPAVQIYGCATLDAVIAALLLGAVATHARLAPARFLPVTVLLVLSVSFLTFGFVWVLPLLFVLDWRRKTLWRSAALLAALVVFYAVLQAASGFRYLGALLTAARLENPQGFRLLASPTSYFFTRAENVAEIAFFAGPFVLALGLRGAADLRRSYPDACALTATALLTLGGLFLSGAYRTGETARACLFIFPFLLLPALVALKKAGPRDRILVSTLVLAQTILMQLFAGYFW